MRPRIVSDRAIELRNGRTLRLYEQGDLVVEWTLPDASTAWATGRSWLEHLTPSRG